MGLLFFSQIIGNNIIETRYILIREIHLLSKIERSYGAALPKNKQSIPFVPRRLKQSIPFVICSLIGSG